MTPNKEKLLWGGVGFVAALLFGWFLYANRYLPSLPNEAAFEQRDLTGEQNGSAGTGRSAPPDLYAGMSYQEVVEAFENRRVQFDEECAMIPRELTFKTGTSVMFDNRVDYKRVIDLDDKGYTIGPYGFIVLTLAEANLPHTIMIGCDGLPGVGQILVQR